MKNHSEVSTCCVSKQNKHVVTREDSRRIIFLYQSSGARNINIHPLRTTRCIRDQHSVRYLVDQEDKQTEHTTVHVLI